MHFGLPWNKGWGTCSVRVKMRLGLGYILGDGKVQRRFII